VFGYPLEACADVMLRVIIDYTYEDLESLRHIVVCLYDERAFSVFRSAFEDKLADL